MLPILNPIAEKPKILSKTLKKNWLFIIYQSPYLTIYPALDKFYDDFLLKIDINSFCKDTDKLFFYGELSILNLFIDYSSDCYKYPCYYGYYVEVFIFSDNSYSNY